MCYLALVLIFSSSTEADIDAFQIKQQNHQTTKFECIKLSEQLSMLTDELQSAKDENVTFVQQIDHLEEEIIKKGVFYF